MSRVSYRDHTVNLISTQDPDTGQWTPKATVTFIGAEGTTMKNCSLETTYPTKAAADEKILEKAKARIDRQSK